MISKDMSNLYLDLAFDVVWIFRDAFGRPPGMANAEAWILKELVMRPAEQKAMALEMEVDEREGVRMQGRMGKAGVHGEMQLALLKNLENQVCEYVLFQGKRAPALQPTRNLLFVLVGLIGDLYSEAKAKSAWPSGAGAGIIRSEHGAHSRQD